MSVLVREMWQRSVESITGSEETNAGAQDDKTRNLTTWKQMVVETTMKHLLKII